MKIVKSVSLLVCSYLFVVNSMVAQEKPVAMLSGAIIPTEFINNIHGLNVSHKVHAQLNLQKKQIRSIKLVRLYKCDRIFDNKTGILLYGDWKCVDTTLRIIMLKSDIEINGDMYKSRDDKLVMLSQLKESDIATIENFPPGKIYNGKTNRAGVIRIELKNPDRFK